MERTPRKKKDRVQPRAKSLISGIPVPAVLSEWFVPRSSLAAPQSSPTTSTSSQEDDDKESVISDQDMVDLAPRLADGQMLATQNPQDQQLVEPSSQGFRTPLSYYTPLSKLATYLNVPSQSLDASLDVLAVVTRDASQPERAKKGPKDYSTICSITDTSIFPNSIQVQIFRPFKKAIPKAQAGDVMLLRNFVVKSHQGKEGLLSFEDSAWRVWRFGKPLWGTQNGRYGEIEGREECSGPPAEVSDEERAEVERLRAWWESVRSKEEQAVHNGGIEGTRRHTGSRL